MNKYEKLIFNIEKATNIEEVKELITIFKEDQNRIMKEPFEFKKMVCELSGCKVEDINGRSKKTEVVRARQIVNIAFVHVFGMSKAESARQINHDHTMFYNSIIAVRNDYETDKKYRELFKEIFDKYPNLMEYKKREYLKIKS